MQALKTKRSIADIIGDIVNESLKTAKKNSKSSRLSEGEDLFDDKSTEDKSSSSESTSEEEKKLTGASDKSVKINDEDEAEKLKSGDITSDDVIEKLNSIRAGKSFKEEEIKNLFDWKKRLRTDKRWEFTETAREEVYANTYKKNRRLPA